MLSKANTILRHTLHHTNHRNPQTILSLHRFLTTTTTKNDDYFAAINHISTIVRRDIYLERTLNKLNLTLTNDLIFRVLRSCNKHGIQCFRFFNWAKTHPNYSPTSIEYDELIKTLAGSHHWETMWKVVEQIRTSNDNLRVSVDTVGFIIREFGNKGCVDEAVRVFNLCPKLFNCDQNVAIYNALLYALCQCRNFYGGYALVRRMIRKGKTPDKETYSILVSAWCKAGKMREAQEFLEEMSRKGFNPPVRGRDLLIDGLLNAGYIENAKNLVTKMAKEGFVPDIRTFNSLLEAVFKSGEVEFCVGLFGDVCRLGLCPDIESYKIMIPVLARLNKLEDGFRLLHCAIEEGHKPFPSLYAPILKALCRNGQFNDAFSFFSDMKVKGHPPNRPVYTMLIRMCVRGGRFVEAANYLVEMTEFNLPPMSKSFDMVTDGLKNCGKHDLAKRIERLEVSQRGF
ncbi:hypothetical protein RND81_12G156600 [Saponaria officinalis]|uniref:Pentatricopeptide repeat-containing protein n=1 Tax=Saponaria officinalis TaxID=3572 RepID=A0AAW1HB21_SAPOF